MLLKKRQENHKRKHRVNELVGKSGQFLEVEEEQLPNSFSFRYVHPAFNSSINYDVKYTIVEKEKLHHLPLSPPYSIYKKKKIFIFARYIIHYVLLSNSNHTISYHLYYLTLIINAIIVNISTHYLYYYL